MPQPISAPTMPPVPAPAPPPAIAAGERAGDDEAEAGQGDRRSDRGDRRGDRAEAAADRAADARAFGALVPSSVSRPSAVVAKWRCACRRT
jgi:hypothetical protein